MKYQVITMSPNEGICWIGDYKSLKNAKIEARQYQTTFVDAVINVFNKKGICTKSYHLSRRTNDFIKG